MKSKHIFHDPLTAKNKQDGIHLHVITGCILQQFRPAPGGLSDIKKQQTMRVGCAMTAKMK